MGVVGVQRFAVGVRDIGMEVRQALWGFWNPQLR